MALVYISSPRWCASPLTSFDQWCVVSVLGAAQVHLSWPSELGADQVGVHGLADSVRDGVLLVVQVAVVEVLESCSSCSSRVVDIPVGYLVGDAQCTLCTGPWGSTGPVLGMVLSACCCATTGAVADSSRVCLLRQWILVLRFYLVRFWKNCTHFRHQGGTQILKSTLRPALHSRSGEVCTVDVSIAEQLHMKNLDSFSCKPLVFGRIFQAVGRLR